MSAESPKGIWIVGATFGAQYARALQQHGLSAIVGRGSPAGRDLARTLSCDYVDDLKLALRERRPTCAVVAVRSAVVGGEGDDITRCLLQAGVPVLQELPIHPQDVVNAQRIARQHGVRFDITPFYDQTPTVRRFIRTARRLVRLSVLRSVEMRVSVQTLHCALFVLSEVLGAPSPFVTITPMAGQSKVLIGSNWQGMPVDIVLMNRFDAASPDENAQPLMQIVLLSDEGELMLHSPFGQVIWERRLHGAPEIKQEALLMTWSTQAEPNSLHRDIVSAIRATMKMFMAPNRQDRGRLQCQLAVLQLWQTICSRAGHPQQYRAEAPRSIGQHLALADDEEEEA